MTEAATMSKVAPDAAYPPPPPPAYSETAPGTSAPLPPPPGYPGSPYGGTAVFVTQPMGPLNGSLACYREVPMLVVCQHCQATVTTTTHFSVGTFTWIAAGFTMLVGCWLGCCLIPFCLNACKDVIHTCPNCKGTVGRFNRLT